MVMMMMIPGIFTYGTNTYIGIRSVGILGVCPFEVEDEESKEETDEGEGTNEEEGIIEDGVDTGTLQLQEEKAIKEKEEDESDVEVIFP